MDLQVLNFTLTSQKSYLLKEDFPSLKNDVICQIFGTFRIFLELQPSKYF